MSRLGNAIDKVKGWFWMWKKEEPTLNEQIDNWTIAQTPTETNIPSTSAVKTTTQNITNSVTPEPAQTWFLSQESTQIEWWLDEAKRKVEEEENKGFWWKVWDFFKSAWNTISSFWKWQEADSDIQANTKQVAMGYDKGSWNVLYLDLKWSKWMFDPSWNWQRESVEESYNRELNKYLQVANNEMATDEEQQKALYDFYESTKDLFRLKSDDLYSDWFFLRWEDWKAWWRRKDNYTDEELELLSANGLKSWDFVPSFNEFTTYLQTQFDNQNKASEIANKYWLSQEEDNNVIDLTENNRSEWTAWFYDEALNWIPDALQNKIWNWAIVTQAMLNYYDVMRDQSSRIYTIVSPVYAQERLILLKDPSERTEWENELLETASKFRKMERAAAAWLNEWMRNEIEYWTNNKWDIVEALDTFEWWKSLSDVLSWEVKRLSWESWASNWSNIDVFEQMANRALYASKEWKYWLWRQAWEGLQRWLWIVWQYLWEWWQYLWMGFNSVLSSIPWVEWINRWMGWWFRTNTYLNQDFTVGRLIETDNSMPKQTIRKYVLQWYEYAPEIVWNLLPDLMPRWWWAKWLTDLARVPSLINKVSKAAKIWEVVSKVTNVATKLGWKYKWLEKFTKIVDWATDVSQQWKTAWMMAKKLLKDVAVDQLMDARLSWYDPEAYSDASYFLSIWWTALTEFLNPVFWAKRTLWWKYWFRDKMTDLVKWPNLGNVARWNIWDIAEYMDSSPEAREYVAKQLWKKYQDINLEDMQTFTKNFWEIMSWAKQAYDNLPVEVQQVAWKWTKDMMYDYISQAYWSNSMIAKAVRNIVNNSWTTPADILKYVWRVPWTVVAWPYTSTIKFKNGTKVNILWDYDSSLDVVQWWFANKMQDWFTRKDLTDISKISASWRKDYSDILNREWELFYKEWDKRYLTEEWMAYFGLQKDQMPLETLWISLARADDVKWLFKDKLKTIVNQWKNITDSTVDRVAETWAYDEVVSKVKEIVC